MKILLFGKSGQLGHELQHNLQSLGTVIALDRNDVDLTDNDSIWNAISYHRPNFIVNAAAYTAVDKAEAEQDIAHKVNAIAVATMAKAALEFGCWLIHYSTDYVFDGCKNGAYTETDQPNPINAYGHTKLEGENAIHTIGCKHLTFRTSWVYGTHGVNFPKKILQLASEKEELAVIDDQIGAPTSTAFLCDVTSTAIKRSMQDDVINGLYHVASQGFTSWHGIAQLLASEAIKIGANLKCAPESIKAVPTSAYPTLAKRPKNSRLDTTKLQHTFGIMPPPWQDHIVQYVKEFYGRTHHES